MDQKVVLERVNAANKGTLAEALGIVITKIEKGYIEGTMPVNESTVQPYKHLHGGASAAFAETLGSMGAFFSVGNLSKLIWGASIHASHVKAVPIGNQVVGKGALIHQGNSSQIWDIHIVNEEDELVCMSQLTVILKDKK